MNTITNDPKKATHILVTYAKISDKEKGTVDMTDQYQEELDSLYDVADIHKEDYAIVLKQYIIKTKDKKSDIDMEKITEITQEYKVDLKELVK